MGIGLNTSSNLSLRITKGKHAGAMQSLSTAPLVIGSSLDADIILTDGSVLAKHLRLTPGASGAALEALDGEVLFEGRSIRPGGKVQARYPFRITFGEAELEMGEKGKSAIYPAAKIGALAAVCAISAALIYLSMPAGHGSLPVIPEQASLAAAAPTKQAGPDVELAKTAAEALRDRLLSLGVDTIDVMPGEGVVSARGTIDAQRKDDWHSVEVWFDENFGQNIVLQSAVSASLETRAKAPIALQAVWAGKYPYIIDAEGNKHFEGAKISGGWVIEKIEESGTIIRKGKQSLVMKY
jgi:hypothetical protein